MSIDLVKVELLRHIEGFSKKRVEWLKEKICREGIWTKPIVIDGEHHLVMDGQHRMEVARALKLRYVPCVRYRYDEVELWSLRPNHEVTAELVIARALRGDPYPYKTVKHRFSTPLEACRVNLDELRGGTA